ncbi:MAG: hypothetical protein CSB46_06915 [Micrococcales bacterium]|nr:MAG: hypothetical protein CSB46_06915 [Micrococcales bacterium]
MPEPDGVAALRRATWVSSTAAAALVFATLSATPILGLQAAMLAAAALLSPLVLARMTTKTVLPVALLSLWAVVLTAVLLLGNQPLTGALVAVNGLAATTVENRRTAITSVLASSSGLLLAVAVAPTASVLTLAGLAWVCIVGSLRLSALSERPGAHTGRGGWTGLARPVALSALMAGGAAVLLAPVLSSPSVHAGRDGYAGPATRASSYDTGPMDLNARGELGEQKVAEVPADSPAHWRSGVLVYYDGHVWYPVHTAGDLDVTAGSQPTPVTRVMGNETRRPGSPYSLVVRPATEEAPLLAPGHLDAVEAPGHRLRSETGLQLIHTTPDRTRTRDLARELTAGATTRSQQVARIEDHLRSQYSYRLDAPVPPAGHDAVDFFLFESGEGFCEHFAAAEAVLLRSVGVPARIAVGYAGGRRDGQWRTITQDRAHAWVEVFIPGQGWLTSDPTPSASGEGPGRRQTSVLTQIRTTYWLWALTGALVMVVPAGLWLSRRARQRRRSRRREHLRRTELQSALDRLRHALTTAGSRVSDAQTVAELADQVPAARTALAVAEQDLYAADAPTWEQVRQAVEDLDAVTAHVLARSSERT